LAAYLWQGTRSDATSVQAEINRLENEGFIVRGLLGEMEWDKENPLIKALIYYAGRPIIDNVLGVRTSLPIDSWVDVWQGPTERVPVPDTPVSIEVFSQGTNVQGGTGANSVRLHLLDANLSYEKIDVDLIDGAATVPGTWLRINPSEVLTAGSYGYPETTGIEVRAPGGGDVYDYIAPDQNLSTKCWITIPATFWPRLAGWQAKLTNKKANDLALFELQRRKPGGVWLNLDLSGFVDESDPTYSYSLGHGLDPGDDIRVTVKAAAANTIVDARFTFATLD